MALGFYTTIGKKVPVAPLEVNAPALRCKLPRKQPNASAAICEICGYLNSETLPLAVDVIRRCFELVGVVARCFHRTHFGAVC